MREFDASSIVHAWDNYPIKTFSPLWGWLAEQFASDEFGICQVAWKEVGQVSPGCAGWLKACGVKPIALGAETTLEALKMARRLGIEEDDYHPDGVDEKDLLIIASALNHGNSLVSNESVQNDLPKNLKKYRIPAVCRLVGVTCVDFVKLLKQEEPDFG